MKEITSINNPKIKELAKLKDKKYRDLLGIYLIEGYHLIEMAKDYLVEILITDINNLPKLDRKVEITIVTEDIINKLSFTKTPQGIIGVCKYFNNNLINGNKLLLLDNLQDPGNIGTLIRTSLAFNIDTIIMSKDSVDIYNDKVIRSSQGAIYNINIIYYDLKDAINEIKNKNILVFGTALKNSICLNDVKKTDKYAIILGNEGNGVSKDLLSLTDFNIKIPMSDKIESLNVSIAGAIILHHFY